jgi:putative SOS response-associated peptidase YedK
MRIASPDNAPFTLAGLWEAWGQGVARLTTCAIITTEANNLMAPIHNRMPAILTDEAQDAWLDPTSSVAVLQNLLVPDRSDTLHAYEVSPFVNSPRNDSAQCWEAVT